ncbi:MAG: M3 family metallopeptidase [Xanthomonadaceae bacterium]|nr:M3 family metallopeptidase [Xanthomonadaceae bacterium]
MAEHSSADEDRNPFYEISTLPLQMPPFDQIEDDHFIPAMQRGMTEQLKEVAVIADNAEPPSFENTIVAMERSGRLLSRVNAVFFNLVGADTNERRQSIQREMSPRLSAHSDAILLNPKLFARIDALHQRRGELDLDAEQARLLDEYHRDFVRAGARLSEQQKERLREINGELARLGTEFSQNVLKEVNAAAVVVDTAAELEGLSQAQLQAASDEAASRDLEGKYVLTLMNFSSQPQLSSLVNRDVREQLMKASLTRGSHGGEFDNREIVSRVLNLRAEKAGMLGYDTHADYVLEERTAGSLAAVDDMLVNLAPVSVANARKEGSHPDVRVFEVFDTDGELLSIFLGDFYARPSKRGGAWMNAYVAQSGLLGTQPVVANHQNIPKPPKGQPTLMTLDEVTTMFHEFGHALHGMFSDVEYPSFAGTSVPRDFVEYPSQVNEMWATWPEILANYALHHETGEQIPQELLDRVIEAEKFNEGYRTTEYLAASILDMCYHRRPAGEIPAAAEILDFEAACLEQAGINYHPVPPRYRTTYFSHIMGGYSAGYYSYIWSEVLDAESVQWIKENGGLKRANGDHFRATLLSKGGSKPAMELFKDFAGKQPEIGPLLERRGLKPVDGTGESVGPN